VYGQECGVVWWSGKWSSGEIMQQFGNIQFNFWKKNKQKVSIFVLFSKVLAISMIGVSEAMNLGVKLGMEANTLAGIFNTSTARCWSSDSCE